MTKVAMKSKVNIDDFLTLIYWVRTFFIFEGKPFAYQNLLDQAETYKLKNTPLNTEIHHIDELMIDAFKIYHRLKETEQKVNEALDNLIEMQKSLKIKDMVIDKEEMMANTKNFERIFEDLIENYRYEDPETRGIQKGILTEKMSEYVANEEYEKAAVVRDIIKEC